MNIIPVRDIYCKVLPVKIFIPVTFESILSIVKELWPIVPCKLPRCYNLYMDIHYLSPGFSAEDKALLVLSVNYYLPSCNDADSEQLQQILETLLTAHPSIPFHLYPHVLEAVVSFYENFSSGSQYTMRIRERDIYIELTDACEALLDKLKRLCTLYEVSRAER